MRNEKKNVTLKIGENYKFAGYDWTVCDQVKRLNSIFIIRRDETFEALQKDVVLDIVKGGGTDEE